MLYAKINKKLQLKNWKTRGSSITTPKIRKKAGIAALLIATYAVVHFKKLHAEAYMPTEIYTSIIDSQKSELQNTYNWLPQQTLQVWYNQFITLITQINRSVVYGMRCISQSLAGLKVFCRLMNLGLSIRVSYF